jgi:hypothetical protein
MARRAVSRATPWLSLSVRSDREHKLIVDREKIPDLIAVLPARPGLQGPVPARRPP